MPAQLALVGDYSPEVIAHRAIPRALELARAETRTDVSWRWFNTRDLHDPARDLAEFAGIWLVPASPYANTAGVLEALRFVRETKRAFLGTCGGFQHALIEFARNVAGLADGDHAETNPNAATPIVTPLACSLVEQIAEVRLAPDSLIRAAYGRDTTREGYRCRYGLNARYRSVLEAAGLRFTAFDLDGEVRAAELPATAHPFFVGTLFQSERAALRGETPPLACALLRAIAS